MGAGHYAVCAGKTRAYEDTFEVRKLAVKTFAARI